MFNDNFFQGGKEVILFSTVGLHDVPVAKATILSTDPMRKVGGTLLGIEFCEVVINHVLKRSAELPRPYGDMKIMVDTYGRSIAWPRQHVIILLLFIFHLFIVP